MPRCAKCKKPVSSGLVIEKSCYEELMAAAGEKDYICPVCQNEEHTVDAKFCKICGNKIEEDVSLPGRY